MTGSRQNVRKTRQTRVSEDQSAYFLRSSRVRKSNREQVRKKNRKNNTRSKKASVANEPSPDAHDTTHDVDLGSTTRSGKPFHLSRPPRASIEEQAWESIQEEELREAESDGSLPSHDDDFFVPNEDDDVQDSQAGFDSRSIDMEHTQGRPPARRNRRAPRQWEARITPTLKTRAELLKCQYSKSSLENKERAKRVLDKFKKTQTHPMPDPVEVNVDSSVKILNLLSQYCKLGTQKPLKDASMGSLIQGLCLLYEDHKKTTPWCIMDGRASGNPLIGNPDIARLRRAHRIHLCSLGILTVQALPMTAGIVSDFAKEFWLKGSVVDVLLHAILVTGLNLGMRYDEIHKLTTDHVCITSNSIELYIETRIKNSTRGRRYKLQEWPNKDLRKSLFMDPYIAVLAWLVVRGTRKGFVFCDVSLNSGLSVLNYGKQLEPKRFNDLLRPKLVDIGIGESQAKRYTGHSLKRGAVQLYRTLGLKDQSVMRKVQMSGSRAYSTYCNTYSDCNADSLPDFMDAEAFIALASSMTGEMNLMTDNDAYKAFIEEHTEVEESESETEF